MTAPARSAVVGPTVSTATSWALLHHHQLPGPGHALPVSFRTVDRLRGWSLDAVYLLPGWDGPKGQHRARVLQSVAPALCVRHGLLLTVGRP